MRVGALDTQDFAGFFRALDEFAQVIMRCVVGVEARRMSFFEHGSPFKTYPGLLPRMLKVVMLRRGSFSIESLRNLLEFMDVGVRERHSGLMLAARITLVHF